MSARSKGRHEELQTFVCSRSLRGDGPCAARRGSPGRRRPGAARARGWWERRSGAHSSWRTGAWWKRGSAPPGHPGRGRGGPGGPGGAGGGRGGPRNVQVLGSAPLPETMQSFVQALGLLDKGTCTYCHVEDRSSDEKRPKQVARRMITMMRAINGTFPDGQPHVTCFTCHRGNTKPLMAPEL